MRHIITGIVLLQLTLANIAFASDGEMFFDVKGSPQNIESFFGNDKWTVMMIWASDCPVCNQEAESYAHLHENNQNIQVVGLSIDGSSRRTSAQEFVEDHDLPFPNLIGEPADVNIFYQEQTVSKFAGTPSFLVFNPDGELMAAQAGAVPSEVIRKFIASKSSAN